MLKPACKLVSYLSAACALLLLLGSGACAVSQAGPTPTPTRTPRPVRQTATAIPTAVAPVLSSAAPAVTATILSTATDVPPATVAPTDAPPSPTATAVEPSPTPEPTLAPAATPVPAATRMPQPAAAATLPPRRGGDWDLESGFYAWQSPHEGFTAFVANGWLPLSKIYDPVAPPRLNENKYLPNVHSGERSQEISFDWRSGEAGIFRTVEVVPGHRYVVEAWARYVPSESGLELRLGIDLGGGAEFAAGSVTWYAWRDMTPNQWVKTQETVRARGNRMTIFLVAVHPLAADGGNKPGGNTMFDNISVTDAGS